MERKTLSESISDILDSDLRFGKAFYNNFFARHPQIEKHFAGVNMNRQAAVLTMTLLVIENYRSAQRAAMATYLRGLGAKHKEWNIPREMYEFFRDALLQTLADFHGEDWYEDLALQWDTAIDHTIRAMLTGYEPAPAT